MVRLMDVDEDEETEEEEVEEEEVEEEEKENKLKSKLLKKEKEVKKEEHKPGDIEPIVNIVGWKVWKSKDEYVTFSADQEGIAFLAAEIFKALGGEK